MEKEIPNLTSTNEFLVLDSYNDICTNLIVGMMLVQSPSKEQKQKKRQSFYL